MAQHKHDSKTVDVLIERGRLWLERESGWDVHYVLFSRAGFNQELNDLAMSNRRIHLFTPESMLDLSSDAQNAGNL